MHPAAPAVAVVAPLLRTASIRERLADAARAMSEEDEALARDVSLFQNASTPLSPREVLEVCAERGLAVGGDHARRLARLKRWCEARATLLSALGAGPDDDRVAGPAHAGFAIRAAGKGRGGRRW